MEVVFGNVGQVGETADIVGHFAAELAFAGRKAMVGIVALVVESAETLQRRLAVILEVPTGQIFEFWVVWDAFAGGSTVHVSRRVFHGREVARRRLLGWRGFVPERRVGSQRELYVDFAVFFLSQRLNTLNIIAVYY